MYRRATTTLLCPVWFMIARSLTPAVAAAVAGSAQEMPRELGRIEAGGCGCPLDDEGDGTIGEACRLQLPVAIDRTEQRPILDACGFQPCCQGAYGTRSGVIPRRDAMVVPPPLLVRPGAPEREHQAIAGERQSGDVEPD